MKILAGMFGLNRDRIVGDRLNFSKLMQVFSKKVSFHWGYDQFFLNDVIYPKIKQDMLIYASFPEMQKLYFPQEIFKKLSIPRNQF